VDRGTDCQRWGIRAVESQERLERRLRRVPLPIVPPRGKGRCKSALTARPLAMPVAAVRGVPALARQLASAACPVPSTAQPIPWLLLLSCREGHPRRSLAPRRTRAHGLPFQEHTERQLLRQGALPVIGNSSAAISADPQRAGQQQWGALCGKPRVRRPASSGS